MDMYAALERTSNLLSVNGLVNCKSGRILMQDYMCIAAATLRIP
jgi:hypothetical protein